MTAVLAPTLDRLIDTALEEDMAYGDITTDAIFSDHHTSTATIVVKQPAVLSGISLAAKVFERVDKTLTVTLLKQDSDCVAKNTPIITIEGSTASILKAERVALNFVQHLSGIATLTYQYVATISQTQAKITHTRKTMPGLRLLERQAVIDGGGQPHRSSLSSSALIKDNHIAAMGSLTQAVEALRGKVGHTVKIEVECDSLVQVQEALDCQVDIILLDNMSLDQLRSAVALIKDKAIVEASGGINLKTVLEIAQTGVDVISTSDITLSAPAVDVSLDLITS